MLHIDGPEGMGICPRLYIHRWYDNDLRSIQHGGLLVYLGGGPFGKPRRSPTGVYGACTSGLEGIRVGTGIVYLMINEGHDE